MNTFTNIPADKAVTFKQKRAINVKLSSIISKHLKLEIKELFKPVGKVVSNDITTHGEAQKYFKIESIKDIQPALVEAIQKELKEPSKTTKTTSKSVKAKKTTVKAQDTESTESRILDALFNISERLSVVENQTL